MTHEKQRFQNFEIMKNIAQLNFFNLADQYKLEVKEHSHSQ